MKNKNYHYEKKLNSYLKENECIIIDNDESVGHNCLTLLYCIKNDGFKSEQ